MVERAQRPAMPNITAGVQITPLGRRTVLRVKSWLREHTAGDKPVVLAGQALSSQVGATQSGPARVLSIAPGEWLIVSHEHPALSLRGRIEHDLLEQGLVLVDLTGGLAAVEVRGSATRELLSKGCGIDFHPRSFPAGRCVRTRFAQIPMVIECLDEPVRFELTASQSYFHYLHAWLIDAAVEFGDSSR
jgi:sarcosine oxidase subunit gamma